MKKHPQEGSSAGVCTPTRVPSCTCAVWGARQAFSAGEGAPMGPRACSQGLGLEGAPSGGAEAADAAGRRELVTNTISTCWLGAH